MAFTSSQTSAVRSYLGYPSVFRWANPRLESALSVVGLDADVSAQVVSLLAKIDNVFTSIDGIALVSAGVKTLDKGDVELYQDNQQTAGMRSIGRTYVNRLSGIFGVPIYTDVFGVGGYKGDGWSEGTGISQLAGLG